jgi:phenol hydroxylase P1 protein
MSLEIKSIQIKAKRETFGHVARRIGEGKIASRYEEATYDLQPTVNFHYLPTYNSKFELYDERKTSIKMSDWYKILDPRQFHYSSYVAARAKQQESTTQNFAYIDKKNLVDSIPASLKEEFFQNILPLRHYEWGANMNNLQLVSEGYGASFTAAAMFQAEDRIGTAQLLTKIALLLSENEVEILETAKNNWLNNASWQGLRKLTEDSFVIEDWFELHLLQNVIADAFVYELFFNHYEKELVKQPQAGTYLMLTGFFSDWSEETNKWIDSTVKVVSSESEENKKILENWAAKYIEVAQNAILPLAKNLFAEPEKVVEEIRTTLTDRLIKSGLTL